MTSIQRGLQNARDQCRKQFAHYGGLRWNCSTYNSDSVFKPILHARNKEAAFAWAITAAGVVASVAKDCSANELEECGCKGGDRPEALETEEEKAEWEGCSDDLLAGNLHARNYMKASLKGKGVTQTVARHNSDVGMRVVKRSVDRKCRCHGVSGSCTVKTCWNEIPSLAVIASTLQKKYKKAARVKAIETEKRESRGLNLVKEKNNETPRLNVLVYSSDSPTYCRQSRKAAYLGTVGRPCNATSVGHDGCFHLCCGRGFDEVQYKEKFSCHCEFNWCCKMSCQTCFKQREVYVCK